MGVMTMKTDSDEVEMQPPATGDERRNQLFSWSVSGDQLINVFSGEPLVIKGVIQWEYNDGLLIGKVRKGAAQRGWDKKDGTKVNLWNQGHLHPHFTRQWDLVAFEN